MIQVDDQRGAPEGWLEELDAIADLPKREKEMLLRDEHPIIVSPSLEIDDRLVGFFAYGMGDVLSKTRLNRARALTRWLEWLSHPEVGVDDWAEAQEWHFWAFKDYRTQSKFHPDGGAISEATFSTDTLSVLHDLYRWAERERLVDHSPIPERASRKQGSNSNTITVKSSAPRVRWATPDTYQMWRDVGLQGCVAVRDGNAVRAGERDPSWKGGRNRLRDVAYVNFMVTTALRAREQSTLLTVELPAMSGNVRLPEGVAKFGNSRIYTPSQIGLHSIERYVSGERAKAVKRAKDKKRYDAFARRHDVRVVTFEGTGRRRRWVAEDGRSGSFEPLTGDDRRGMFVRDEKGRLEPLMLWLNDDGLPMSTSGVEKIFERANDRVFDQCEVLGMAPEDIPNLSQHSLRFTFALWQLLALHRRIDERKGGKPEKYDEDRYEVAFDVVRDLLGHADVETTRKTYLKPAQTLWVGELLGEGFTGELSEVISRMTAGADLVLDTGTVFVGKEGDVG
ncbi:hypothetical protein QQX13_12205 [Demequina sp. SYSU T00068]|uniref:hypothetical protein n=1 Tax=Demequina lignilytica TaxID=3051663 RepID=UPI002635B0F9|nr:hypothetical protein [Demequina sp. SYSU T00068]MDN4491597.1 hypothetical protein [Demequina sp. SYSU T00068]